MAKRMICFAIFVTILLFTEFGACKRTNSGKSKTSGSGSSTRRQSSQPSHVTKPTYSSSGSDSHSDLAKLSYSGYNSQSNHPQVAGGAAAGTGTQNAPAIGWNVPKQQQPVQGPPPAYSASNPVGGARTNINEAPPAYNAHAPITATHTQGVQSSYPGYPGSGGYPVQSGYPMQSGIYHSPGSLPAGASYPAGGYYPHVGAGGYNPQGGLPAGGSYYSSGSALPPGAVLYSQPPASSSGLGFGSGLAAGALGGALLGHVLTPTQSRDTASAPQSSGSEDKIIIINNGQPVTTTQLANGTTIINTGIVGEQNVTESTASLAPILPVPAMNTTDNATVTTNDNNNVAQPPPPAPGGIICVPMRINETDPTDNTKVIEVEKIACYPAPSPAPQEQQTIQNGTSPLSPMNPIIEQPSQQLQQTPQNNENKSNGVGNSVPTTFLLYLTLFLGFSRF